MRPRTIALLAALLTLLPAAPALAGPTDPVTYGAEVLARDADAVLAPDRYDEAVAAFEGSWTHRALRLQAELAGDVGMVDAPWPGTHNSFNSLAESGPTRPALSPADSNQRLTLVDQLRLGVRSLELDVHLWLGRPVVCHAQSRHEGCSTERPLAEVLGPVAAWLREHPDAIVLLYLEDHLDSEAGYAAGADVVRTALGDLLYAPRGEGCTQLPDALSRDDVRAAGAQVVVVSDCGQGPAWPTVAHAWDRHVESRPRAFEPFPSCGPDFSRADYDTRLVRYFEDSTWLTASASEVGAASRDDGLTPGTTAAMTGCGVDLFGFDQLLPGDGRLEAHVWSWAEGQPAAGDCAVSRAGDGRWATTSCGVPRPAACRHADGSWSVSRPALASGAPRACAQAGGVHAAPRTGYEQTLLRAAAGGREVVLGLQRVGDVWRGTDPR